MWEMVALGSAPHCDLPLAEASGHGRCAHNLLRRVARGLRDRAASAHGGLLDIFDGDMTMVELTYLRGEIDIGKIETAQPETPVRVLGFG